MSTFAASLAHPVVCGMLSIEHAHAAILVQIAQAMRAGNLTGNGTLEERAHIDRHILDLNIQNIQARRERASGSIARILRPLIEMHAPRNRLLAEAHNANEDAGHALSEDEVEEIAAAQVFWSMQRRKAG